MFVCVQASVFVCISDIFDPIPFDQHFKEVIEQTTLDQVLDPICLSQQDIRQILGKILHAWRHSLEYVDAGSGTRFFLVWLQPFINFQMCVLGVV